MMDRESMLKKTQYMMLGIIVLLVIGSIIGSFHWFSQGKQAPMHIAITRWVPPGNNAYDSNIEGFKDALAYAGYIEGEDVFYTIHHAHAQRDVQAQIAENFLEKKPDLIYSLTTPGTQILQETITDIPIIFSIVTYPVEAGIIDSVQASGNMTVGTRNWISIQDQLRLFRSVFPDLQSIAFLHRTDEVNSDIQLEELRVAARLYDIDIMDIHGNDHAALKKAIETMPVVDSLFSACDTLVQAEAEQTIIDEAMRRNIPSFTCNKTGVYKGDLLGMVADFYEIGYMSGEKAAKVLSGVSPSDLQTDTVLRPRILLHQTRAKELGVTFSQELLSRAEEIID